MSVYVFGNQVRKGICAFLTATSIFGFLKCHVKSLTIQRLSCSEKAEPNERLSQFSLPSSTQSRQQTLEGTSSCPF